VANQVLVKHPFNKAAEIERKKAIEAMLKRTHAQVAEDNAVLAEAKAIEERRRTETAARGRATNAPTPNPAQQSGAGHAGNAGRTTASAPGAGTPGPSVLEIRFPERLPNDPGPGMPSLLDANLQPFRPAKPGVVARGTHTVGLYNTMLANLPGGPKAQKAVETALIELGGIPALSGPKHCSRAVTGAWLALRTELFTLQDLRRQLPGRAGLGLGGEPKTKKRRN
ncbi:SANT domain-containing protein, partial [Haematococcus lacustris]